MKRESTDKETISKFIASFFWKLPVYMKFDGKFFPIKVISLTPGGLLIKSTVKRIDKDQRILSLTNKGFLFVFIFNYIENPETSDTELLEPAKLITTVAKRTNERVSIGDNKESCCITDIINQNEIISSVVNDTIKIGNILKNHTQILRSKFEYVEFFMHERQDNRLRLMLDHDKSIFIPDRNNPDLITRNFIPYKEYRQIIKLHPTQDRLISEICIPVKYKSLIPYGYIQVMHSQPLDQKSFEIVQLIANSIMKDLLQSGVFRESKEKCFLLDLSQSGFSFQHQNTRNFSKIFSLGGMIICDLFLETEKITTRAIVRNIKPLEKNYRIGCEIYNNTQDDVNNVLTSIKKYLETKKTNLYRNRTKTRNSAYPHFSCPCARKESPRDQTYLRHFFALSKKEYCGKLFCYAKSL